jgi:hypothetical protein
MGAVMKGYWVAVIWFAAIALIIDAGWGISSCSDREDRVSFQAEFGIAYPSTPVQKEIAKAVVAAHIDALYQKSLASWKQYYALEVQYDPDTSTPSVKEAQAKLSLSQEVDKAKAAHMADFERLGASCLVLYETPQVGYDRHLTDKYSELSIPRQSDCEYYFVPNSN